MNKLLLGAVAGAAGTLALDITSYADMALRGRPSSSTPAELVRKIAEKAGVSDLAKPDGEASDAIKNRRTALGALSGYAVGIAVGTLYGALDLRSQKIPPVVGSAVAGAAAMAASDVSAASLGVTDPKTWGATGWIADIVPHAAYGAITAYVYEALS